MEFLSTADGSTTLYVPDLDETYHSRHGAVQESRHVFIEAGLRAVRASRPAILEVGLGTGLNALLTASEAALLGLTADYTALEAFPLAADIWTQLTFPGAGEASTLALIHEAPWEARVEIFPGFILHKVLSTIEDYQPPAEGLDLIYYDAFGPRVQPDMWTVPIFRKLFEAARPGAIWVSYCSKGQVRRDLEEAGWAAERLPGPPGKREMLRAKKP
ncbi:MAG: tRNA (5-methylaminomethyl-2-thiouridine)(34)-methyltransferase MnmD [Flavobacteriales bacterium]